MTRTDDPKRVLFVSLKKEAEPLLGELRSAGHQVSIVDKLEDAQALLTSGAFDQAVIPGQTLEPLLLQHSLWEQAGGDSWRRSTLALVHDLRNLLQRLEHCMRGLAELDLTGSREREELLDLLRSIATLSVFLMELTDDLDAGSTRDLNVAVLDLEDAIEAAAVVVYPSASERRQRLVIDIDEEARYIRADPTRMKRAFSHLLSHASRQSPSRGTVTVCGRRECDDCVISISYTAETVSLAGLGELFRPAGLEHAGSGLYHVQNIIEQHSGRLWLESQRGAGTSVFVSLPLEEVAPSRTALSLTPG
ncbi:MAG: HAMP domain-containing histidine kinase [Chloroflexi bacterium]|nr:MAG: HAMP domain-containing histidine kinase [Chloroflexota bacterium]